MKKQIYFNNDSKINQNNFNNNLLLDKNENKQKDNFNSQNNKVNNQYYNQEYKINDDSKKNYSESFKSDINEIQKKIMDLQRFDNKKRKEGYKKRNPFVYD